MDGPQELSTWWISNVHQLHISTLLGAGGGGGMEVGLLALFQCLKTYHTLYNLLAKHFQERAFPQKQCSQPQAVRWPFSFSCFIMHAKLQIKLVITRLFQGSWLFFLTFSMALSLLTVLIRREKLSWKTTECYRRWKPAILNAQNI